MRLFRYQQSLVGCVYICGLVKLPFCCIPLPDRYSYTVPSTDITSTTQISDQSEYFGKYKNWIQTYSLSEECENCYNLLWSDLETMNVSW